MQKLRSDPVIFSTFLVGLTMAFILAIVIAVFYRRLPPQMPFLYSVPWGESQLVSWQTIVTLPTICLALVLISTLLSLTLLHSEQLLARVVAIGGVLTTILIITTCIKIILLTHL